MACCFSCCMPRFARLHARLIAFGRSSFFNYGPERSSFLLVCWPIALPSHPTASPPRVSRILFPSLTHPDVTSVEARFAPRIFFLHTSSFAHSSSIHSSVIPYSLRFMFPEFEFLPQTPRLLCNLSFLSSW